MAATEPQRENETLARAIPERIMTDGDADYIDEVFAPDFVEHNPAIGEIHGPEGFREYVFEPFRRGFSDLRVAVEDVVAEGDRVVLRVTISGTHDGPFMGIEPTGKPLTASGFALHRLAGGKVAERWVLFDALGVIEQTSTAPTA
ncbi:ester cyclase [Halomarina rubra]|uniref:Ester cyclase n=1 Tax=Halomarina rubra TaxID=2071873 RepID=A0ABD6B0N6_9EURY|nr:ester cyclase [Halomarina rubra]